MKGVKVFLHPEKCDVKEFNLDKKEKSDMMVMEREKIGEHLKRSREKAGYSQVQLANLLGISRQTISNWENDKTIPDGVSLIQLAEIYHISLDELCGRIVLQKSVTHLGSALEVLKKISLIITILSCSLVSTTNLITFSFLFLCFLALFLYFHFQKYIH